MKTNSPAIAWMILMGEIKPKSDQAKAALKIILEFKPNSGNFTVDQHEHDMLVRNLEEACDNE